MKKIFFLILVFFIPLTVQAEDVYLNELKVLNGELSLPFDSLNTEYTVTLEENEFDLMFDYKVNEGVIVTLDNNHDLENDSVVTLMVQKDEDTLAYHFHILKETNDVIPTFKEEAKLEQNNFMFKYKIYIIPATCLFLIFISYKILFPKKKKHKKYFN